MGRFVALLATAGILALAFAGTADASTSYIARLGTEHGAARLTVGGANTIYVNAKRLSRGTWTEALYRGTCAKIVGLPALSVGARGSVARTNALTAAQARLARTGVIRLARGSAVACGSFAVPSVPKPTSKPTPTPSPTASSAPAPGTVLMDVNSRGTASETFQAPPNWEIDYAYDCSNLGQAGTFSVNVYANGQPSGVPVNDWGSSGGSAAVERGLAGSIRLEILTACDWEVLAVAD